MINEVKMLIDEKESKYRAFSSAYMEIDTEIEMLQELKKMGFKEVHYNIKLNHSEEYDDQIKISYHKKRPALEI